MNLKSVFSLGAVLMVYAAAACVGLAFVYTGTADVIERRTQADLKDALKELFPEAGDFEDISGTIQSPDPAVTFESEYAVKQGGKLTGAVLRASSGSYGGTLKALVGVNADGTIKRIKIMEHSDTPGLGSNAADPAYYVNEARQITFYGQFEGKAVSDPFEPKNDIVAITSATITSRAVSLLAKTAGQAGAEWLAAQGEGK